MARFLAIFAFLCVAALAQTAPERKEASTPAVVGDFSGMYSFLREGEFLQIDLEDGRVTGFISRYGDLESDKGAFLDHLIRKSSLEGNKLAFTTSAVHGVSFEFKGTVERGEGKAPGAEAYHVLKGTLTQSATGPDKKVTAKSREVVFKSFPQDAMASPAEKH